MPDGRLVIIGRAARPFGVKGELKITPYTQSFEAFERSATLVFDHESRTIRSLRIHKGAVLVLLEGVNSPEEAQGLVGSLVKTDRENLPPKEEDEYYWFELIDLQVITTSGESLGRVTGLMETGANDVLHVEGPRGEVLLPLIDEVVLEIDIEGGRMVVDPLEGLIPDA